MKDFSNTEHVDLNSLLTAGNPDCILIRVRGDSMSDEITDGDWVMLDQKREARPGDMVLEIDDADQTSTIRRFSEDPRRGLRLVGSQPVMRPVGVVTHVIHAMESRS